MATSLRSVQAASVTRGWLRERTASYPAPEIAPMPWTSAAVAPIIEGAMGTRSKPRPRARRASPLMASRALRAVALLLGLGCGDGSLDGAAATTSEATTSTGSTLPPLDTSEAASSSGDASTGEPTVPDDPRLCPAECTIVLPSRWAYEATPPPRPVAPGAHVVPAMLRDADGTLTVAELVDGQPRLHRLDHEGRLQWNVPLPLPCAPCELTDVSRHPSGDLLLSATGVDDQGELALLAVRYDATRHARVWMARRPLVPIEGVHVRSGGIAALSDELVAQLYMRGEFDFDLQRTFVIAYGADGTLVDEEELVAGSATGVRPPLLARPTAESELLVGVFGGTPQQVRGMTDRMEPPLWNTGGFAIPPAPLDDIELDARGHAIELGHTFDGAHAYLLLADREGVEPVPRWIATLALPTTTSSTAALALGPQGDPHVAIRTTQAPGGTAEPLVGLSLSRWTPEGELRWHTTFLQAVAESFAPLALAVDDDGGLLIAAVVDGRLRVEHRAQQCACGS
jgi:hypothetical protein